LRFSVTYINIHSYNIHSSGQSSITFIHKGFLVIAEEGKVSIHRKDGAQYRDDAGTLIHVVQSTFRQDVRSLPIGGGVGGA
jgi:hypothetical protein